MEIEINLHTNQIDSSVLNYIFITRAHPLVIFSAVISVHAENQKKHLIFKLKCVKIRQVIYDLSKVENMTQSLIVGRRYRVS